MDLVTGISDYQQGQTAQQIQLAVAKKSLDAQRQEGAAALQLLQSATQGSAPRTPGLGDQVDVLA